ncbi:MAG: YlxM family DNA-binding protein [Christensenellales bacterium]
MENFEISILTEIYGSLLTNKQREMMQLYFDCDLSLAEIAEQFGISRQAARDAIKRGEEAVKDFENNLHFAKFIKDVKRCSDSIRDSYAVGDDAKLKTAIEDLNKLTEG